MSNSLFRKKSLDKIMKDAEAGLSDGHATDGLHKVLTVRDLTFMGIAAVVGAGIFLPSAQRHSMVARAFPFYL